MKAKFELEGGIINGLSNATEIKRLAVIGEQALATAAPKLHKQLPMRSRSTAHHRNLR